MASAPPIMNIHTPTASFAIVHLINEDSLEHLFDKLSRKSYTDFHGERVGPGWIKYHWNETFWNLDDDADYTIFVWRQKSSSPSSSPNLSASSTASPPSPPTPTLHVHNPSTPLPVPPAYRNPAFYLFLPQPHLSSPGHAGSVKSSRSKGRSAGSGKHKKGGAGGVGGGVGEVEMPQYKKDFEKFHSENGVRTVMGSIGPVQNVRMLLKSGYRHVYISRKFAMKHGFIPSDAAPGHYGYGGLVNIGTWPVTLQPLGSSSLDVHHAHTHTQDGANGHGQGGNYPGQGHTLSGGGPNKTNTGKQEPKSTPIPVYLSEEPHFDVVLGRSFFERRQIKTNPTDPTEVVCLDTGERVEVEVVVLKDGRGEIVIVT